MSKFKINKVTLYAANLIAVQLVFALADMYEITLEQVFETFTKLNYWKVLNNTEICCILAHDGIKDTVSDVSKQFDTIFGTQLSAYKKMVIPFDSQSITIIEQIMKDKKLSRQDAMTLWFSSKTYEELIRRKLTYISAMRGYWALNLELEKNPKWMTEDFE